MSNLKLIISKNIAQLRTSHEMTQMELAGKLNYSDKAVSKWERGESIPDIAVLKDIADLFGVTVDYLLAEEHSCEDASAKPVSKRRKRNHGFITGMCILLVWLVAAMVFVIFDAAFGKRIMCLFPFLYAIPCTFTLWLIFNSVWFNPRRNFLIISALVWSCLAVAYLTLLYFGLNIWLIFILGIPSQAIIIMWSKLKLKTEKE